MSNQNQIIAQLAQMQPLKFELVELYVSAAKANQQVFNFSTNQEVQGKRVLFIDAQNIETVTVSPQGHDVVSVATYQKSYLNLYSTAMDKFNLQAIPLISLNPFFVNGGTAPNVQERILLNNPTTDWNKCTVTLGSAPGVGDFSFLFGVWYIDN